MATGAVLAIGALADLGRIGIAAIGIVLEPCLLDVGQAEVSTACGVTLPWANNVEPIDVTTTWPPPASSCGAKSSSPDLFMIV
jgi:hypothetical protein